MKKQQTKELQFYRINLINEMAKEINQALTENAVFSYSAHYTNKIFESARSSVALLTDSKEHLEVYALAGETGRIPKNKLLLSSETALGAVVESGKTLHTPDFKHSHYKDHKMLLASNLNSGLNTALITGGQVIGTLNVAHQEVNQYDQNDVKIIEQVASIMASNIQNRRLVEKLSLSLEETDQERLKSEELLLNILPYQVAQELKLNGYAEAREYSEATVMFSDFENFTGISREMSPKSLVNALSCCFGAFDRIIDKYGLEKIKTLGDGYMCAGGIPVANNTHVVDMLNAAFEFHQFMSSAECCQAFNRQMGLRIGIHTGSLVAGVVGIKKFAYDVWGDTVNIAARMEQNCEVGRINVSQATKQIVSSEPLLNPNLKFEPRGKIEVKGKGEMDMYYLKKSDNLSDGELQALSV